MAGGAAPARRGADGGARALTARAPSPAASGSDAARIPLSIIIPAFDESASLPALLADLARLPVPGAELIVADGGSSDGTVALATAAGARVVTSEQRGRGVQLRAGAAVARGTLLCFLHADVRLDDAALRVLAGLTTTASPPDAWAFRLRIDAPGAAYRVIERMANLRSRALGLPYGDQGLIVSRAAYDAAGGFAAVPLMEDVMLVRALRRGGVRVRLLPAAVHVSARRWRRDGPWRRSARNLVILLRWLLLGASPESLVKPYERSRR